MNEYVSLRIFSITDDLCNDTQSRPPWRLSPRKGGVLQQSVENTVMGEHRVPGVPKEGLRPDLGVRAEETISKPRTEG